MFTKRVVAYYIDIFIFIATINLVFFPILIYLGFVKNAILYTVFIYFAMIVVLFSFMLYMSLQEYYFHQSIGKRIMKLKIAQNYKSNLNKDLLFSQLLIRNLFKLLIPFLIVKLETGERVRLHEKLSHTKVVEL